MYDVATYHIRHKAIGNTLPQASRVETTIGRCAYNTVRLTYITENVG